MELIKLDGKPIEKLIEEVSKGIGTLYKPRAIRKEAEAEAKKIEIIANAEAKKSIIEYDTESELIRRTKERLFSQEINRQRNIEDIAEKTITQLPKEVSDEPLDEDWRTRFFNKAQDISEEETQEVWAKILAGEISKPGRISMRTLEVVSNINKKEAELFEKACSLATANSYILKLNENLDDFGIKFGDLLTLRDAGLMHSSDNLIIISKKIHIPSQNFFAQLIGKDIYQLRPSEAFKQNELKLPQLSFTKAGEELCGILNINLNNDYLGKLITEISNKGFTLTKIPINNS